MRKFFNISVLLFMFVSLVSLTADSVTTAVNLTRSALTTNHIPYGVAGKFSSSNNLTFAPDSGSGAILTAKSTTSNSNVYYDANTTVGNGDFNIRHISSGVGSVNISTQGTNINLIPSTGNNGVVNISRTFTVTNVAVTATAGAALSLDLRSGNNRDVTFGAGNITNFTATNIVRGDFTITLTQDGVGSRLITWDTAIFKFPGATPPTLSVGAGKTDVITFACNGTICRQKVPIQLDVR